MEAFYLLFSDTTNWYKRAHENKVKLIYKKSDSWRSTTTLETVDKKGTFININNKNISVNVQSGFFGSILLYALKSIFAEQKYVNMCNFLFWEMRKLRGISWT